MRFFDNYVFSDDDTIESVQKRIAILETELCREETTLRYLMKEQRENFDKLMRQTKNERGGE